MGYSWQFSTSPLWLKRPSCLISLPFQLWAPLNPTGAEEILTIFVINLIRAYAGWKIKYELRCLYFSVRLSYFLKTLRWSSWISIGLKTCGISCSGVGNHLTMAPSCGVKLFRPLWSALYMLKSPADTTTRYLSVSVVGALSQNVNICPDHWRFFRPKCHICILLESQFPLQLPAKMPAFTSRLDIWRAKGSRQHNPQSINLKQAIMWILHQMKMKPEVATNEAKLLSVPSSDFRIDLVQNLLDQIITFDNMWMESRTPKWTILFKEPGLLFHFLH